MTSISIILNRKGHDVATIRPEATLAEAVDVLATRNIGALVVSSDGASLLGIVSERDIVRSLAESGAQTLTLRAADVMSTEIVTCGRDATVDQLMTTMTERRVRHIPVLEEDRLIGVVSIGDVVKSRLDELEVQAEALESYVSGRPY